MAKYKGYFDATEGSPNYDSAEHSKVMDMLTTGIQPGYMSELEVAQGVGLQVTIDSGGLFSRGRYLINDEAADGVSPEMLDLDAASSGYLRKDRAVVEFDIENKTATLKISKGTEALADPDEPSLVDTETKWEVPLAIINVAGSAIDTIEDDRYIYGARVTEQASIYCKVKRGTSNQTSGANVEFQTAIVDEHGVWNVANPDRLTAPEDGDYLLTYDIGFTTTQTGYAQTSLNVNGMGELMTRAYCNGSNALLKGPHVFRLSAGDYVTIPSPVILDSTNYVRNLEVCVTLKKIN